MNFSFSYIFWIGHSKTHWLDLLIYLECNHFLPPHPSHQHQTASLCIWTIAITSQLLSKSPSFLQYAPLELGVRLDHFPVQIFRGFSVSLSINSYMIGPLLFTMSYFCTWLLATLAILYICFIVQKSQQAATARPATCLVNEVLWEVALSTHLYLLNGCFHAKTAGLSSCT